MSDAPLTPYRFRMRRVYAIFAREARKQARLYRLMGESYG